MFFILSSQSLIGSSAASDEGGDVFQHGDIVTITGTGFGSTMPTFGFSRPYLEAAEIGDTPDAGNNESGGSSSPGFNFTRYNDNAVMANDETMGKVLRYVKSSGTIESAQEYRYPFVTEPGDRIFISYYSSAYGATTGGSGQMKFERLQNGVSSIEDADDTTYFAYLEGSRVANVNSGNPPRSESDPMKQFSYGAQGQTVDGVWRMTELKLIYGEQGEHTGQLRRRACTPGSVKPAFPVMTTTEAGGGPRNLISQWMSLPDSNRPTAITWQNWAGNGITAVDIAYRDHYISNTFRRVELWNTNDPATATRWEIQEPLFWSDDSIDVKLNAGAMEVDQDYYLVVLSNDVNDTVIGSRLITLVGG